MGIIAIRHGQSEISYKVKERKINNKPTCWEEVELFSQIRNKDTEDSGLSVNGKEQAGKMSKELKNYKIDKVYISQMKRVKETYEILQKECDLPEYNQDKRLNAILSGILHGHINENSKEYFDSLPFEAIETKQLAYNYQTGESQFRAVQRVYNFLDDIKKEWEEKNVLLITHKSTLRIINTYFTEILDDEIYKFNPKNLEVTLYGKIFN